MLKVYEYNKCSTCRNALKFLDSKGTAYKSFSIIEQPPTLTELKKMLGFIKERGMDFKSLFNTSGVQYRQLGLSQKIKDGLTEKEALELLSNNGKLIKRPFLLGSDFGLVGFKVDEWKKTLK